MTSKPVPVIVLAGFLGSGKTTLLNHLLRRSGGTRIGGDRQRLRGHRDRCHDRGRGSSATPPSPSATGVCAAPSTPVNSTSSWTGSPAPARIDVIVIEASGLAEPQELVTDGPRQREPAHRVRRARRGRRRRRVRRHPRAAPRDRPAPRASPISSCSTRRTGSTRRPGSGSGPVRGLGRRAAVVSADVRADRPGVALRPPAPRASASASSPSRTCAAGGRATATGTTARRTATRHAAGARTAICTAAYESVSFTSDEPLSPRRLMDFLDSRPEGLYRIKGYVDFGAPDPRNRYAVHAVGRFLRFYPEPWAGGRAAADPARPDRLGHRHRSPCARSWRPATRTRRRTRPMSTACGASCATYRSGRRRAAESPPGTSRPARASIGYDRARQHRHRLRQRDARAVPARVQLRAARAGVPFGCAARTGAGPPRPAAGSPRPSGSAGSARHRSPGPCAGTGRTASAWPSSDRVVQRAASSPRP